MAKGIYTMKRSKVCVICSRSFLVKRSRTLACHTCKKMKPYCACGCGERTRGLVYRRKYFGDAKGKFGYEFLKYVVGHGCRGKKFSAQGCLNMKAARLKMWKVGGAWVHKRNKKIRESVLLRYKHPTAAMGVQRSRNLSIGLRKAYADGRMVPPVFARQGTYLSGWMRTKKAGRIFYRSSWEKTFFQLVDKASFVTSFEVQPLRLPYKYKGTTSTYFPDCLVHFVGGSKALAEVKGYHQPEEQWQAKKRAGEKYCTKEGIKFFVFRKEITAADLEVLRP